MKKFLILAIVIITSSASAEPWDKLVNELTEQRTLTELITSKSKFYSRSERTRLTRELDFGYSHTTWEFDYVQGISSARFFLKPEH